MGEQVETWRAKRRLDMGGGRFREPGELYPEGNLLYTREHAGRLGALERVRVSAEEFRAAIEQYCQDLGDRIIAAAEAELPGGVGTTDDMVTIRSTDNPEAAYAPVVGPEPKGTPMERTEGDQNYLRERTDMDPAALNEALTATRPADIESHDPDAAYKEPVVADYEGTEGFRDPIGSTPSGAVGPGSSRIPADVTDHTGTATGTSGDEDTAAGQRAADEGSSAPVSELSTNVPIAQDPHPDTAVLPPAPVEDAAGGPAGGAADSPAWVEDGHEGSVAPVEPAPTE